MADPSSDKKQGQTEDVLSAIRSLIEDDMDKSEFVSPSQENEIKKSLEKLAGLTSAQPTFLEATIAQTVRPFVKEWLKEHLPDLVEDIIRKEIRRLAKDK